MRRLWWAFWIVVVVSFTVLGWVGGRIYQEQPPVPTRVVTTGGTEVIAPDEILDGQAVWRAMGGMEVGSVWGHGSYVAPDWTADWLHREALYLLDWWAQRDHGTAYEALPPEQQAALRERLVETMRHNTYNEATGEIAIPPERAQAFAANLKHYADVFSQGRAEYAIPKGAVTDSTKLRQLSAFFFWTSWAASTERPGGAITYTQNWPHEPLVGNRPSGETVVWTGVSIILLLGGISALVWFYVSRTRTEEAVAIPESDPLIGAPLTPSQKATLKYFLVVSALILVQILVGVITAHYGVEGNGFYGIPLAKWLPYSVTPLLAFLRWMRVPGDTVFALGAIALVWVTTVVIVRHLWRVRTEA
jgi:nitric oxide reductase subunit B